MTRILLKYSVLYLLLELLLGIILLQTTNSFLLPTRTVPTRTVRVPNRIPDRIPQSSNVHITSPPTSQTTLHSSPPSLPSLNTTQITSNLSTFKSLSTPYFSTRPGQLAFLTVLLLTLLNSTVSVQFSYVGRDFWSSLNGKDPEEFGKMMVKFTGTLVAGVPVSVLYRFYKEKLSLEWRDWMTRRTLRLYYSNKNFYSLEMKGSIDNPDQRISEDVKSFTSFSLTVFITLLTSSIDLISFSTILFKISPELFASIFGYAAVGTGVSFWLGGKLVPLNFEGLRKEADFRYSIIRVRENAESIAFYEGETKESSENNRRLSSLVKNAADIIGVTRNLEFFTTSYRYLVQVLPVSVVAPLYFKGDIALGVVSQSSGAFNHILSDLSLIVNQFESLSAFSAGVERLEKFYKAIGDEDESNPLRIKKIERTPIERLRYLITGKDDVEEDDFMAYEKYSRVEDSITIKDVDDETLIYADKLTLSTPDGSRMLIRDLSFELEPFKNLLIVGSSGSGKSSFLRAIAGLWTRGDGVIGRPRKEEVLFLPQKPYCPLGDLRVQMVYGGKGEVGVDDEELLRILERVDLPNLAERVGGLDAVVDWSNVLSLGEQQRLAFSRILVNRPRLAILDEATSALDLETEEKLYRLIEGVDGLNCVSVGHRPSLAIYHDVKLRLKGDDGYEYNEITKKEKKNVAKQGAV
ncbi:hypothetical protein TrST_g2468 [Triparma strigata]|uniref:Uncharacterized protein n=1 Tax=Triparma strigata TaxID=1606541 RepID=A0A9W7BT37_9STRA|nr:hypothetical protein TrST_g2468 [Triparma strigata]